ncbi:MAG: hypothetical protein MR446_05780 [Bacteroidales bacterium]|nr:hypothetical protein [Bacteroidales bacterium]
MKMKFQALTINFQSLKKFFQGLEINFQGRKKFFQGLKNFWKGIYFFLRLSPSPQVGIPWPAAGIA